MERDAEREFWLEQRKALLIQVRAIEERYRPSSVTVTLPRDDAERRGLLRDAVQSTRKN